MELVELQKIAQRRRMFRETGFALLIASAMLTLFLFIPARSAEPTQERVTSIPTVNAFAHVPIEAGAAIVYDLATQTTLYEKNADAQLPLASLTKLLSVYAALEKLPRTALITIPAHATKVEYPRLFSAGETLSLDDLARLTLTASLNDGAIAIAEAAAAHTGDSTTALLAGVASALELSQTYAVNGSGLDMNTAVSGGYGSAKDVALLAGALLHKAPEVAQATTQPTATAVTATGATRTVKNTDPIVGTVPHLLLSKTGYTDLAGGNLALVIDVGIGHPVAIVVLGSTQKSRFTDGEALVAATLAHFAGVASL